MQYHGIPCNTMECRAIPWNAIQYHTIPCNMAERHTRLLEQTYFTYYGGFPITNIDQKSHEYENWKLKSFWLPMSWSSLQFQYEAEYFLPDPISSPHLHLRCPLNREFSSNWCLSQCEWFPIIEFLTYSNRKCPKKILVSSRNIYFNTYNWRSWSMKLKLIFCWQFLHLCNSYISKTGDYSGIILYIGTGYLPSPVAS